jgi:hypothetical protein
MPIFLVALLQTAPMITPSAAPPFIVTAGSAGRYSAAPPAGASPGPYIVEVDASAGGRPLWHGNLRISERTGASFQRTLSEAPPETCAASSGMSYPGFRDSFSVNINPSSEERGIQRQNVRVEWQRPSEDCAGGSIQRTVQVSGIVQLIPGKPATVQGDGGLVVRLTRRDGAPHP